MRTCHQDVVGARPFQECLECLRKELFNETKKQNLRSAYSAPTHNTNFFPAVGNAGGLQLGAGPSSAELPLVAEVLPSVGPSAAGGCPTMTPRLSPGTFSLQAALITRGVSPCQVLSRCWRLTTPPAFPDFSKFQTR